MNDAGREEQAVLPVARCYGMGLERVAKVVEGIDGYDSILGEERLRKAEYQATIQAHLLGKVDAAAAVMARMVRTARLSTYRLPDAARILSFGKTHNNRVQIDYFERKTRPWRNGEIVEVSACELDRRDRIGARFGDDLEAELRAFLLGRKALTRGLVHQLVGYSASYCSMLATLEGRPVTGLVVANDHSPTPVAISMACKAMGVARVYLQHAQVTSMFPALDFEYSLLMNRRSEQIYLGMRAPAGSVAGHVAVVRRDGHSVEAARVLERVGELSTREEVMVGLYPSSVFHRERLVELVSKLKANPGVAGVFLKPHPSARLDDLAASLGIELRTEVVRDAHVAITGNSSVAQELAVAGNLVFQDFALDPVARDYYGFVEAGIAAELEPGTIGGPFWHGSREGLADALDARLSEANHCLGPAEEEQLFKRISLHLGGGLAPASTQADELNVFLRMFPRTFLSLRRTGDPGGMDDFALICALDALFNERTINLNRLYPCVDPADCASVADFWLVAKLVQWSGKALADHEIAACMAFVSGYRGETKVRRWMEAKVFDLLLQMGKSGSLAEFLASATHFNVKSAHLNKKIAFVKICNHPDAGELGLDRYYDHNEDGLGPLERLKIDVQCMIRQGGALLYDDYRAVEARFLECATPSLAAEYSELVCATYGKIAGRDRFIDVKRSPREAGQLADLVGEHLRAGRGFSVVRLSDGEGYLFQQQNPFFTREDALNRERHWWGEELDQGLRDAVIASGLETVAAADVVGIPSIYRFLRDCSPKSTSLLASLQGRGLVSVLQGVLHHASDSACFGDDKLNLAVFNKRSSLEAIAAHSRRTIVVTGAREDVVRDSLGYLGDVEVVNVPTHHKTSSNERFFVAEKPLPYVFREIRDRIREASSPGTLVLVGAGIAGKSFVHAAKSAGGVGLDLGSALDELVDAGIHSLH